MTSLKRVRTGATSARRGAKDCGEPMVYIRVAVASLIAGCCFNIGDMLVRRAMTWLDSLDARPIYLTTPDSQGAAPSDRRTEADSNRTTTV